ncbi:protein translocase subunit SecF [Candidatus Wolfebacteria bacterium]|nr:protein translocase subunit SecF [Candidatus Wolfebacteria bacterium]
MFVVHYKKIFLGIGALLIAGAIGAIMFFNLSFSIDFTGGTLLEISYTQERPSQEEIQNKVENLALGSFSVRSAGEDGYIIRTRSLNQDELDVVTELLTFEGNIVSMDRITTIGPSLGNELGRKALFALMALSFAVVFYVAYVFRRVSKPVPSIYYGLIVVLALLHDILIPTGFFAIMGYYFGAQIDTLFVVALLAILGYSVNDTIVVFDRIRENIAKNIERNVKEDFEMTVGKSLRQTYVRSINTSVTTALALLALFFLGSGVTENFALVLLVGVVVGTYSSIFLAAPLLVLLQKKLFKE